MVVTTTTTTTEGLKTSTSKITKNNSICNDTLMMASASRSGVNKTLDSENHEVVVEQTLYDNTNLKGEEQVEVDNEDEDDNNDIEDEDDFYSSMLFTLYLPMLLLWLRRGMFGTANLFRSLILGHCLSLILSHAPIATAVTENSLLAPFFKNTSSTKVDPQAWPPPALVALAALTIFTLVVHPDGFTWIMLGKTRDAIVALFRSCTTCWGILMHDYGVIPTLAAAFTFATILCFIAVIWKTLRRRRRSPGRSNGHNTSQASNNTSSSIPSDRKKKKKKGHARQKGRIKQQHHQYHQQPQKHRSQQHPPQSPSSRSFTEPVRLQDNVPLIPSPPQSPSLQPSQPTILSDSMPNTLPNNKPPLSPSLSSFATSVVPTTSASTQSVKHDNDNDEHRSRIPSASTLETSVLSDDQSCGSSSARSLPSISVASSRSHCDHSLAEKGGVRSSKKSKKQSDKPQQQPQCGNPNVVSSGAPTSSATASSSSRRQQHGKRGKKSNHNNSKQNPAKQQHNHQPSNRDYYDNVTAPPTPVASSRWDALKPVPSSSSSHNNHHRPNHARRGGGSGSGHYGHKKNPRSSGADTYHRNSISHNNRSSTRNVPPPMLPNFANKAPPANHTNISTPIATLSSPSLSSPPPPPPGLGPPVPIEERVGLSFIPPTIKESLSSDLSAVPSSNWSAAPAPVLLPSWNEQQQQLQQHHQYEDLSSTTVFSSLPYHAPNGSGFNDHSRAGGTTSLIPFGSTATSASVVKENPFDDCSMDNSTSQIEQDLQELGGRMTASILDF